MTTAKNMVGQRFGLVTIIERAPNYRNAARWRYRCDCGNEGFATGGNLRQGFVQSCGCRGRDSKHGHTWKGGSTPTYKSWRSMLGRCTNLNHHKYPFYGALGVKVCEQWLSFTTFLADMGERPQDASIDRFPDRNGNYEPGNCRWATIIQQNNNKKTNVRIKWRGVEMTVAEAARTVGIVTGQEAAKRIKRGWSIEDALSRPLHGH